MNSKLEINLLLKAFKDLLFYHLIPLLNCVEYLFVVSNDTFPALDDSRGLAFKQVFANTSLGFQF